MCFWATVSALCAFLSCSLAYLLTYCTFTSEQINDDDDDDDDFGVLIFKNLVIWHTFLKILFYRFLRPLESYFASIS